MTDQEQRERETERSERTLQRHGDLEDRILQEFCRLYNAEHYAEAWGYATERKEYIERLWSTDDDPDIRESASKLIDLCIELKEDARKTQETGVRGEHRIGRRRDV